MCILQNWKTTNELIQYCITHLGLQAHDTDITGMSCIQQAQFYNPGHIGVAMAAILAKYAEAKSDNDLDANTLSTAASVTSMTSLVHPNKPNQPNQSNSCLQ